jgi:hypothetical protein
MIHRKFVLATVAGILVFGVARGGAMADTVTQTLGQSGWSVRFDNTEIAITLLNVDVTSDSAEVVIEKIAQFDSGPNQFGFIDPAEISFIQNASEATGNIVVDVEHVFNNTGVTWSGFRFIIEDPMSGVGGGARFDQTASAGFDVSPFTDKDFISSDVQEELFVSGGAGVPSSGTDSEWTPGFGLGAGSLVINANPFENGSARRVFVFKEQPVPGDGFIIPLPAAAWTGLSGLLGLVVANGAKALRRRTA